MRAVRFQVPGPVTPWARPGARVVQTRPRPGAKSKAFISWYTDPDVDAYQAKVMAAFAEACGLEAFAPSPLHVRALIVEPRPKATMRLADDPGLIASVSPKDVDNYAKVILDALQRCGRCCKSRAGKKACTCVTPLPMIDDDKLVTRLEVVKVRAEVASRKAKRSAEPRAYVWVAELEGWAERVKLEFPEAFSGEERW